MTLQNDEVLELPGAAGRERWAADKEGGLRPAGKKEAKLAVLALEALAFDSALIWTRTAEPGQTVAKDALVALHWEAAGIKPPAAGKAWTWWPVQSEGGWELIATAALAFELEDWSAGRRLPAACEITPRLFFPGAFEAALWQEGGRLVLACYGENALVSFAVLSNRVMDHAAASEVRELVEALELWQVARPHGLQVWADCGEDFLKALQEELEGIPCRRTEKPAPRLPEGSAAAVDPPSLALRRRQMRSRKRLLGLLAMAAACYAAFFAVWGTLLALREGTLAREKARLDGMEAELAAIRDAQGRWHAAGAATDRDRYPVEIFHQVTTLLPPEGIRMEEFLFDIVEEGKLVISGQASGSHAAVAFLGRLKEGSALGRFAWDTPVPTILPDNRASFRAEATLSPPAGGPAS